MTALRDIMRAVRSDFVAWFGDSFHRLLLSLLAILLSLRAVSWADGLLPIAESLHGKAVTSLTMAWFAFLFACVLNYGKSSLVERTLKRCIRVNSFGEKWHDEGTSLFLNVVNDTPTQIEVRSVVLFFEDAFHSHDRLRNLSRPWDELTEGKETRTVHTTCSVDDLSILHDAMVLPPYSKGAWGYLFKGDLPWTLARREGSVARCEVSILYPKPFGGGSRHVKLNAPKGLIEILNRLLDAWCPIGSTPGVTEPPSQADTTNKKPLPHC